MWTVFSRRTTAVTDRVRSWDGALKVCKTFSVQREGVTDELSIGSNQDDGGRYFRLFRVARWLLSNLKLNLRSSRCC